MFFTRRRGGMGLGLALSRQLVEGHGGQIGYMPNTPRGSVFHFTLPDASRPSEPA
jgi:two-component system sensor histidine kinase DctS